jgi:hypothetical protein
MKKYLLLTKTLLKTGLSKGENTKKKKFQIKSKLMYLLVFICFIPWMIALFFAGSEGYNLLSGIGQEGVVIGLICSISGIVTFVFGVSIIISVFVASGLSYLLLFK